jgi:tetratricopeptide (TPR) repeat protein
MRRHGCALLLPLLLPPAVLCPVWAAPKAPRPDFRAGLDAQVGTLNAFKELHLLPQDAQSAIDQATQDWQDHKLRQEHGPLPAKTAPAEPQLPTPTPPAQQEDASAALKVADRVENYLHTNAEAAGLPTAIRHALLNITAAIRNQIGDGGGAVRNADAVLSADPNDRDALNNRAMGRYGLGQYPEAVKDASRAVARGDPDPTAYTTRALAQYQLKNYVQAIEDAKRALAFDPNNEVAFQITKLASARITTPEGLRLDPLQLADARGVEREYEAMLQERDQIENRRGNAPVPADAPTAGPPPGRIVDSLNQQAQDRIKAGDYPGALQALNSSLERYPDDPKSLELRAGVQNLVGQYARAVEDAAAAIAGDPDNVSAINTRASALLQLGRPDEALTDADRAVSLDSKNAYAYTIRARIKEHLGDLPGMLADYKTAARLSTRFEPELERAARQYRLPLSAGTAAEAPESQDGSGRRFLVVLVSSLTGGLLIAIGLVHIISGQRGLQAMKLRLKSAARRGGARPSEPKGSGPLSGYTILRTIGTGGMGIVYEALDRTLERKVAIKQLRQEVREKPKERTRFLQEARIVAQLHHPNIVDIHAILEDGPDLHMVFEFVDGRTLEELLSKKGRLTLREARYVVHGICSALQFAHSKNVIHRDLKPSNIMVTDDGRIKVMDFGIARQAKDVLAGSTSTQTVAGTPLYMAPEQLAGVVRRESDIYALGACLYEMLTGAHPFDGPTMTSPKLAKAYPKPSRVAANLPAAIDALIDAALDPDPDARISSAAEFAARLEGIRTPVAA